MMGIEYSAAAGCPRWELGIEMIEATTTIRILGLQKTRMKCGALSDAELFANRSALFTNGGEFRYAPL